ncbi:MAG TPA: hypothetical protein VN824_21725 [Puia sp.]|nr:hypothetical protein [Puia sp.]
MQSLVVVATITVEIMAVKTTIETIVIKFTAITPIGIEITVSSVVSQISAIEPDVTMIMTKIGTVMTNIFAIIPTTLSLGGTRKE